MSIRTVISTYVHWLHLRWPAGKVEKLPIVGPAGRTNLPGVRIAGDLRGIPLLKFASRSGVEAVASIVDEPHFRTGTQPYDLVILGAGIAGISAAMEAQKRQLNYLVLESNEPFSTIINFPTGKPIFTYPVDLKTRGGLQFATTLKEDLVAELESQKAASHIEVQREEAVALRQRDNFVEVQCSGRPVIRTSRVIVAIGKSGKYRRLGCPGENLNHVFNRLHDPADFAGAAVAVVGGGDTALEATIALARAGAKVTLVHRQNDFGRAKPENVAELRRLAVPAMAGDNDAPNRSMPGTVSLLTDSEVVRIERGKMQIRTHSGTNSESLADAVFIAIGREPPRDFLERSQLAIHGHWTAKTVAGPALFLLFCCFLYAWKDGGELTQLFRANHWFPYNLDDVWNTLGGPVRSSLQDSHSFLFTLRTAANDPGFFYSLAYVGLVAVFGLRRIAHRRTPYVTRQTSVLIAVQAIPLFLLPYLLLPWLGQNGWFDHGLGKVIADNLFPVVNYAPGREYWRAFGLVLAWPLFIWNLFTSQPLWWWLVISLLQTGVVIPLIVRRWGKGAYCGWICSCGALAETLGDKHRTKMPHGPFWNRLNLLGQIILGVAFFLFILRVLTWLVPWLPFGDFIYYGLLSQWHIFGLQLNYHQLVDTFLAGTLGFGLYFFFSGRTWCRFACPLAALMHVYARFGKFRIFADKKKCISCNVCTSVCHQGIDVMNFANKGLPMQDPECVRCSACVQQCPTDVLAFGRYTAGGKVVLDQLRAR